MFNRKILVLSCKRSTHHAFIESFLSNENYTYENNLKKDSLNAWKSSVRVESENIKEQTINVKSLEMNYDCAAVVKEFENYEKIFYLRDPLNVLASLFSVKRDQTYIRQNILQFENVFNFIANNNINYIYANNFWTNKDYRKNISYNYNLSFNVSEKISTFAKGGHTFFGDSKITPNALISRVEKFNKDKLFLSILEDHSTLINKFLNHQKDDVIEKKYNKLLAKQ